MHAHAPCMPSIPVAGYPMSASLITPDPMSDDDLARTELWLPAKLLAVAKLPAACCADRADDDRRAERSCSLLLCCWAALTSSCLIAAIGDVIMFWPD